MTLQLEDIMFALSPNVSKLMLDSKYLHPSGLTLSYKGVFDDNFEIIFTFLPSKRERCIFKGDYFELEINEAGYVLCSSFSR